ncbi:MAG TPA: hypothetical protein VFV97_11695 [Rhodanobacteraceae bacterium]|nr:hypothetical protein [Rhodanobacteraceae bacterium]
MRANLAKAAIAFAAFWTLFTTQQAAGVALNPRGLGQVLIYPYYTVNHGQDTLLSIANAGDAGKVVHLRFHEAYNARNVLDFDVFLSAHDVWTAAITQANDSGPALIRTSDHSCTNPPIVSVGQQFLVSGYTGTNADSGPQAPTRTREGFIEVIAVGDVTPGSALDQTITHVQTGTPGAGVPECNQTILQTSAPTVAPTPNLFGSVAIVNVGQGTFFGYTPDALTGFTDHALGTTGTDSGPTLEDANTAIAAPATRASVMLDSRPIDVDYQFPIDAVSAVFMADSIYNEYFADPSLGAATEWIVTLPTRGFYTDPALTQTVVPPFAVLFAGGRSDTVVGGEVYDREEGVVTPITACTLCPPVAPIPSFPYAVNDVAFINGGGAAVVFGSNVTPFTLSLAGATTGNAVMDFVDASHLQQLPGGIDGDGNTVTLLGLPVTGFMAYNVINTNAQPGLLANYSGVFANRATASCAGSSTSCTAIITQQNPR